MNPHELDIAQAFIYAQPQAAARELESQPLEAAVSLIEALSLPALRKISPHLVSPFMARICSKLPVDFAAAMLADATVTRCSLVLRCVAKEKRAEILDILPHRSAALIRLMLSYSEDSVGAHMNPHIVMLSAELQVGQALSLIAEDEGQGDVNHFAVVDQDQRPLASVSLRALLRARSNTPIARVLSPAIAAISSRAPLTSGIVNEAFGNSDSVWVLNRDKRLVGVFRHQDLRLALANSSALPAGEPGQDVIEGFGSAYGGALVALLELFRPARQMQEGASQARALIGEGK